TQAVTHELHALLFRGMAVDALVHGIEARPGARQGVAVERALPEPAQRDAQLIALPRIAHVELALESRRTRIEPFGRKLGGGFPFQLMENRLAVRGVEAVERTKLGANVVVQHVGAEEPERRERTRPR